MVVNTREIDRIEFKYPEFENKDLAETIKSLYEVLYKKKDYLADLNEEANKLEREIKELELKLSKISPIYNIVYKTKVIEDKQIEECNLSIINPEDARHTNYK